MKVCPKCNKKMKKALQVMETEATWWKEEGVYVAKPNGKHHIYEKCLICGTELQETDLTKREAETPLTEFPNFRLPNDGQIQKQKSESFEDLIIKWKVVTKMLGAELGRGVQFRYPGIKGIVIAFIDGFEWHPKVNVFVLSAESEFWGSYTEDPRKILQTLKECVRLVLKGGDSGIVKDNIYCIFNA